MKMLKNIACFVLYYVVRPVKRSILKWMVRLNNNKALIETSFICCDNYKQITIGRGSSVRKGTVLQVAGKSINSSIVIGENTYIGENNNLRAADGIITIGSNCMISQGVSVVTSNHATSRNLKMNLQPWVSKRGQVMICDDVWIGANAVILPDCVIHEGAVIGAGSIVTKNIPAYAIACGNPAKVIKFRE